MSGEQLNVPGVHVHVFPCVFGNTFCSSVRYGYRQEKEQEQMVSPLGRGRQVEIACKATEGLACTVVMVEFLARQPQQ